MTVAGVLLPYKAGSGSAYKSSALYQMEQADKFLENWRFSKGGKQGLWDDQLLPMPIPDLQALKEKALADKDKQLVQRINKEEKRRGVRNK